MATSFQIKVKNRDAIIARLRARRAEMAPESPTMRLALTRAAVLLQGQAKLEIRKQRLIDLGRLLNSIKWEFYQPAGGGTGVRVGSFGVPYAAIWEFGARGLVERVKPHERTIMQAFGKPLAGPVRVQVRGFSRKRNVIARPYLKPAYEIQRDRIVNLVAKALAGAE